MHKLPNPKLPAPQARVYVDNKTFRGLKAGTKLPHIGSWQRIKQQLKASGQWFWRVQHLNDNTKKFIDSGEVVITSYTYRYAFVRRMTKKEVFEYVKSVAISQQTSKSVKSVNQPANEETSK